MTTPYERLRALRWGAEMLAQITSDASVARRCAERAQQLAVAYPDPDVIADCLRSAATSFPPEWVSTFNDAANLFRSIGMDGTGSDDTRECSLLTRRHYPPRVIDDTVWSMFSSHWRPGPYGDGEFESLR